MNQSLESMNRLKTGTTTLGMVVKDAVILAADKRTTMGNYVANKTSDKIHKIDEHIGVTEAGSAADGQNMVDFMKSQAKLFKLRHGRHIPVNSLVKLLSGKLYGAKYPMPYYVAHVVGGVDADGPKVYDIGGIGSILKEKFTSTGSGSRYVYGVLEDGYKDDMNIEEGVTLARKAVKAAISRDIFSGNGIDIVVITRDKYETHSFDPTE